MTTDTVGGLWTYALELSRALAARDVTVVLATMGDPLRGEQRAEADADGLTVFESAYRLDWMEDPWDDFRASGDWLLRIADEVAPDIVHLNGFAHATLSWGVPTVVVGHSCVLSWWDAVHGATPLPEWRRYQRAVATGLHCADEVVASTHAVALALARYYGPLPPATIIPNGRSRHRFIPAHKERLVLSAGRLWDEGKNMTALDAAAAHLPWPVVVAGDVTSPDGQSTASSHLQPLGRLAPEEVAEWMGRASIFALPSRYEPFGLAPLEAALAGCALVLGDIPSLRESWSGCACFALPGDHAALEAAIRRLIDDEPYRFAMAAAARARALTLTPERMADDYLRVYARACAREGEKAHPRTRQAVAP